MRTLHQDEAATCLGIPAATYHTWENDLVVPRIGDANALIVGLALAKCWDAGALGDFEQSVGMFLEIEPTLFLNTMAQDLRYQERLRGFLVSSPLVTTDNFALKIHILERRRAKLKAVSDSPIKLIRDVAVDFVIGRRRNFQNARCLMLVHSAHDSRSFQMLPKSFRIILIILRFARLQLEANPRWHNGNATMSG